MGVYVCVYMCLLMYVCAYVSMCVYVCVCVCEYINKFTHKHTLIYACVYICAIAYAYIHVLVYIPWRTLSKVSINKEHVEKDYQIPEIPFLFMLLPCYLYFKQITIINDDRKSQHNLEHNFRVIN